WSSFGSTAEFIPLSISPFVPNLPANSIYWYPAGPNTAQGGSGTWDTTDGGASASLNWNQNSNGSGTANVTFSSANYVVLGGSHPTNTVTITGTGVTANGIDVTSDGYVFQGGNLTLGATRNTIDVAAGDTATIYSRIGGTNGLNAGGFFFGTGTVALN